MPNFKYKAISASGERIENTYIAGSREEVIEMISRNSYYPLSVEEQQEGLKLNLDRYKKVTGKDISIFCRQFYTMLDAGASINNSIHILAEQHPNKRLREALAMVEEEIQKGETLSDAMRNRKGIFPDLLISLIETGEVSGTLDSILERMSGHYEKEVKINNKLKNAMIYPSALMIVSITIVAALLIFVMPIFVTMFESSGVELPFLTRMLLALSNGLRSNFLVISLVLAAVIFGIRYYLKTDEGILFLDRAKLKVPIVRGLNEKTIASRFTRTLSTVIASGISVMQGLQIVSQVVGNKVAEEKLMKAREALIRGEGLYEPLKNTKLFPPMLYSMIKIGEESGALDEILNKTADFYDEELDAEIANFTAALEPIMIVFMGVIIGIMIISIITPMFAMYNTM
ncbi:type II secretion system F family protein [Alloiococcus sp. CFN-8]|uniref:type II secretion system F family protein n=1 Tax=Alloiococcus sp. CFN-8 TaxID=3416081 RepID=UPI003CF0E2C5